MYCVCILSIVLDISACVCTCCVTLWSADIHVSTYLAYMYQKYVCVHVLCFSGGHTRECLLCRTHAKAPGGGGGGHTVELSLGKLAKGGIQDLLPERQTFGRSPRACVWRQVFLPCYAMSPRARPTSLHPAAM